MNASIDQAGRLVIPKPLREQLGLRPGPVVVTADGAALRVEAVASGTTEVADGRTVIAATGAELTDAMVRDVLESGRR